MRGILAVLLLIATLVGSFVMITVMSWAGVPPLIGMFMLIALRYAREHNL